MYDKTKAYIETIKNNTSPSPTTEIIYATASAAFLTAIVLTVLVLRKKKRSIPKMLPIRCPVANWDLESPNPIFLTTSIIESKATNPSRLGDPIVELTALRAVITTQNNSSNTGARSPSMKPAIIGGSLLFLGMKFHLNCLCLRLLCCG